MSVSAEEGLESISPQHQLSPTAAAENALSKQCAVIKPSVYQTMGKEKQVINDDVLNEQLNSLNAKEQCYTDSCIDQNEVHERLEDPLTDEEEDADSIEYPIGDKTLGSTDDDLTTHENYGSETANTSIRIPLRLELPGIYSGTSSSYSFIAIDDMLKHCRNKSELSHSASDIPASSTENAASTGEEDEEAFAKPVGTLELWRSQAESELSEHRNTAAKMVVEAAKELAERCTNQIEEFFGQIEQFMQDIPSVQLTAFEQLRPLFIHLRQQVASVGEQKSQMQLQRQSLHRHLLDQANMRFPALLIRALNSTRSSAPAIKTIKALVEDQDLLAQEVLQHLVVPALFAFLSASSEEFVDHIEKCPPTTSEAELWIALRVDVFSILHSILVRWQRFPRRWIQTEFLPRFTEFFTEPNPLILRRREIREILAESLAPMAEVVGTKSADMDLLPIFQRYMRDTADVQYALLRHLAEFCKILSPDCRESLVRELSQLVTIDADTRSWRQRGQFADQLSQLVPLFPIVQINRHLSAFALTFAADRIAEVRGSGIGLLAAVLGAFVKSELHDISLKLCVPIATSKDCDDTTVENGNMETEICFDLDSPDKSSEESLSHYQPHSPLTERLVADIRSGFWRTRCWRRRQSFGRLLYSLLQGKHISDAQFYYLFFHDLMHLSDDDVANVRQYFCLLSQLEQFERFTGATVRTRLERIADNDTDMEIRHLAKIAVGRLNPDEEGLDLQGRAERVA